MIRINLLPHREMRRERRKKDFIGMAVMAGIIGAGASFMMITFISQMIGTQNTRNEFIKAENTRLEAKIKDIASLRTEIEALKARQRAVENLQSDRTLPVHLLDELVKRVPEGIQLKSLKQDDLKVTLVGIAQSNDRISELLRQLAYQTEWLEKPELGESKAIVIGDKTSKEAKRAFEFSISTLLKRPAKPVDPNAPKTGPGVKPTTASAAAGANEKKGG
jgi:type IV pilus assembly protein PilN